MPLFLIPRLSCFSFGCDEFTRRTPKASPNKMTEHERRLILNVVSDEEKANISSTCSPESVKESTVLSRRHSPSETVLLQSHREVETAPSQPEAQRVNELSAGYSESILIETKPTCNTSDVGVQECHSVLPCVKVAEAGNCSFERRWGERTSVEREIRPLAQRSDDWIRTSSASMT